MLSEIFEKTKSRMLSSIDSIIDNILRERTLLGMTIPKGSINIEPELAGDELAYVKIEDAKTIHINLARIVSSEYELHASLNIVYSFFKVVQFAKQNSENQQASEPVKENQLFIKFLENLQEVIKGIDREYVEAFKRSYDLKALFDLTRRVELWLASRLDTYKEDAEQLKLILTHEIDHLAFMQTSFYERFYALIQEWKNLMCEEQKKVISLFFFKPSEKLEHLTQMLIRDYIPIVLSEECRAYAIQYSSYTYEQITKPNTARNDFEELRDNIISTCLNNYLYSSSHGILSSIARIIRSVYPQSAEISLTTIPKLSWNYSSWERHTRNLLPKIADIHSETILTHPALFGYADLNAKTITEYLAILDWD
ncbi:MAG: hypothetical protein QXT20_01390 [Candidatus Woesearchaeota archaeon]